VAEVNPTSSTRRIEGRQRGDLEIVATRWTELRRHPVSVCEIGEHGKCAGVARGKRFAKSLSDHCEPRQHTLGHHHPLRL